MKFGRRSVLPEHRRDAGVTFAATPLGDFLRKAFGLLDISCLWLVLILGTCVAAGCSKPADSEIESAKSSSPHSSVSPSEITPPDSHPATAETSDSQQKPSDSKSEEDVALRSAGEQIVECLTAINKGVTAVTMGEPGSVQEVFQAVHLELLYTTDTLKSWIASAKFNFVGDPAAWYIVSGSPRLQLPDPLPRGKARFEWVLNAPQADPVDAARKIFTEFLMTDLDGILLTHQLLMINIAKSRRLELSPEETARENVFLERVRQEFAHPPTFSHLMVRLCIMRFLYDEGFTSQECESRVRMVLDAQDEDGFWTDPIPASVEYDGEVFSVETPKALMTLDCAYLLALNLKRFHEE